MRYRNFLFPALAVLCVLILVLITRERGESELPEVSPSSENIAGTASLQTPGPPIPSPEKIASEPSVPPSSIPESTPVPVAIQSDRPSSVTIPLIRIFGVVKNERARIVKGAEVRAVVLEDMMRRILGEEAGATTTGLEGKYKVYVPAARNYLVIVSAAGYAASQRPALGFRLGTGREIELNFRLTSGAVISGIVKDTEGNPIPGATVSPWYQQTPDESRFEIIEKQIPPKSLSVTTDESGRFSLAGLHRGIYTLAASKQGFSPAVKKNVPSPLDGVEIILMEGTGGVIAGNVYYFGSGAPAPGAEVSIRSLPFTPDPIEAKAGDKGDFQFEGLIPGSFEISSKKDQLQSMPHDPLNLESGEQKMDVILRLFDGYTISGRVLEEGGMTPLAGVDVSARTGFRDQGFKETTDDEGSFLITGIFNRTVFLFAEKEGYFHTGDWGPGSPLRIELPLNNSKMENVDLAMSRGVRISGVVVSLGDELPISGAEVRFHTDARIFRRNRQPMTTNAKGRFTGYVHNNTRFTIQALHPEYADGSTNPITVSDQPLDDIVVEMGVGGSVAGVVITPDEEPVPGARVTGRAPAASVGRRGRIVGRQQASTDASGRFLLQKAPPGEYILTATAEGYTPSSGESVMIPEGGMAEEVRLVLKAPHFIAGFVKNEEGEPVVGARVIARKNNIWRQRKTTYSEPDGSFRIEDLTKGTYRLNASKDDAVSKSVEAKHDSSNVEIILNVKEYVTLKGFVLDSFTDDPVTRFTLKSERGRNVFGVFASDDGFFQVENLVRGRRYRFRIEAPGYVTTLSPQVRIPKKGDPPEPVFRIGNGGSILGRVVLDRGGGMVEGAKVTWTPIGRWNPRGSINRVGFTGDDGHFLFEKLAPQKYSLKIEKSSYPETLVECGVKDGEITDLGDIVLKSSSMIRGTILDGGAPPQPVPDKIVRLDSIDRPVPLSLSYKTTPDGIYIFSQLPEGKYRVNPVGGDYKAEEIELKAGEKKSLDFHPKQ